MNVVFYESVKKTSKSYVKYKKYKGFVITYI